jgi:two-component system, NtrC family, sensor kinase
MGGRGRVAVSTLRERDHLVVSISDNGIGMDREVQRHILEPFFTTREIGQATGLGLSTAYSIVRKHGGTLDFDSSPRKGSTFHLRFPLSPTATTGAEQSDALP